MKRIRVISTHATYEKAGAKLARMWESDPAACYDVRTLMRRVPPRSYPRLAEETSQ